MQVELAGQGEGAEGGLPRLGRVLHGYLGALLEEAGSPRSLGDRLARRLAGAGLPPPGVRAVRERLARLGREDLERFLVAVDPREAEFLVFVALKQARRVLGPGETWVWLLPAADGDGWAAALGGSYEVAVPPRHLLLFIDGHPLWQETLPIQVVRGAARLARAALRPGDEDPWEPLAREGLAAAVAAEAFPGRPDPRAQSLSEADAAGAELGLEPLAACRVAAELVRQCLREVDLRPREALALPAAELLRRSLPRG